jgi:cysteine synthase
MSRERFEWLASIGAEVIKTPGGESNVKEIYDKCWEIRRGRKDCVIFNQFEEFGNAVWHYHVTGPTIDEVFGRLKGPGDRLAGYVSATGSAGTIAAGDFLRTRHPAVKVVVAEAQQCPTLLACGFGDHRIEGIGDKHVPWIHNVRNTDLIAAIDDEQCMSLMRLFNEDAGRDFLESQGVGSNVVERLPLVGISGICNLVAAIKTARFYEMSGRDVVFMPLTDSMGLYQSRLAELSHERGAYTEALAGRHFGRFIEGINTDHLCELGYHGRKRLHNLKYFTWVEQQGKTADELRRLWDQEFWAETFAQVHQWDRMIQEFNGTTA